MLGAPRGEIIEDVIRGRKFERVNVLGAVCNEEYFAIESYKQTTNGDFLKPGLKAACLKKYPKAVL